MSVEETPVHSRANPTDTPTLNTTSFLLHETQKKETKKHPPPQKVQNNLRATNKRGEFFSPHAAVLLLSHFCLVSSYNSGQSKRSPSDQAGASKRMAKQQGGTPSGQETRRTQQ